LASYLLIVNPAAGKGAGGVRAEVLRSLLERDDRVELVETSGRGHATDLALSRGLEFDRVVAVGGDGTLNEVLCGLMSLGTSVESRPCLGFLPGGTANVATAAFGFCSDPRRLASELPGMVGRPVDVGVARVGDRDRPFLLWCGAGIDAVVIDELNSSRTGRMGVVGLARNAPRVLSAVARYTSPAIHVTADDSGMPPASSVILANVGQIAFGGSIHPEASPFDGWLDVVTVENMSPVGVLAAGVRMLLSNLTSSAGVEHRTATRVTLSSEGSVPVQIDGEAVGHLPLAARLERAAIRLLVGAAEHGP